MGCGREGNGATALEGVAGATTRKQGRYRLFWTWARFRK